eukprot:762128-Hanusia_phi.AAC.7
MSEHKHQLSNRCATLLSLRASNFPSSFDAPTPSLLSLLPFLASLYPSSPLASLSPSFPPTRSSLSFLPSLLSILPSLASLYPSFPLASLSPSFPLAPLLHSHSRGPTKNSEASEMC